MFENFSSIKCVGSLLKCIKYIIKLTHFHYSFSLYFPFDIHYREKKTEENRILFCCLDTGMGLKENLDKRDNLNS